MLSARAKTSVLQDLAHRLESAEPDVRLSAARIILYILEGAYGDFADSGGFDDDDDYEKGSNYDGVARKRVEYGDVANDGGASSKDDDDDELFAIGDAIEPSLAMDRRLKSIAAAEAIIVSGMGDRGSGGHEEQCILNAAANAYCVYEAGLFQVDCFKVQLAYFRLMLCFRLSRSARCCASRVKRRSI